MLVLSRKPGQSVRFGRSTVTILETRGKCRVGIDAPGLTITRGELDAPQIDTGERMVQRVDLLASLISAFLGATQSPYIRMWADLARGKTDSLGEYATLDEALLAVQAEFAGLHGLDDCLVNQVEWILGPDRVERIVHWERGEDGKVAMIVRNPP